MLKAITGVLTSPIKARSAEVYYLTRLDIIETQRLDNIMFDNCSAVFEHAPPLQISPVSPAEVSVSKGTNIKKSKIILVKVSIIILVALLLYCAYKLYVIIRWYISRDPIFTDTKNCNNIMQ